MAEDPFFYVCWKGKTLDDPFPWRWVLFRDEHDPVAESINSFSTPAECEQDVRRVVRWAPDAEVIHQRPVTRRGQRVP